MSFMSKYATDKSAEENGVWVSFDDDVRVCVARLNNKSARDLRRKLEAPFRHFSQLPDAEAERILIEVVANTVIKDWEGVPGTNGKPVKYSPAEAIRVLKQYPDFLGDVISVAAAKETFAAEGVEAAKND